MLTYHEAKRRCGDNQMRLQFYDGEYRVTPFEYAPNSPTAERIAYYTDDREDAVITASQMRRALGTVH